MVIVNGYETRLFEVRNNCLGACECRYALPEVVQQAPRGRVSAEKAAKGWADGGQQRSCEDAARSSCRHDHFQKKEFPSGLEDTQDVDESGMARFGVSQRVGTDDRIVGGVACRYRSK